MNRKQFLATIAALPIVGRLMAKDTPGVGGETFKVTLNEKYYNPDIFKYPLTKEEAFKHTPETLGLWGVMYKEMVTLPPFAHERKTRFYAKVKKVISDDGQRLSVLTDSTDFIDSFGPNDTLTDEKQNLYWVVAKASNYECLLLERI